MKFKPKRFLTICTVTAILKTGRDERVRDRGDQTRDRGEPRAHHQDQQFGQRVGRRSEKHLEAATRR